MPLFSRLVFAFLILASIITRSYESVRAATSSVADTALELQEMFLIPVDLGPAGNVIVRNGGAADIDKLVQATAAAGAGAIDGYELEVGTESESTYRSTVYRFPDADTASAWVRELPSRYFGSMIRKLQVNAIHDVGDDAFLVSYAVGQSCSCLLVQVGVVRVGSVVAILSGVAAPPAVMEQLLPVQSTCLANHGCGDDTSLTVQLQTTEIGDE